MIQTGVPVDPLQHKRCSVQLRTANDTLRWEHCTGLITYSHSGITRCQFVAGDGHLVRLIIHDGSLMIAEESAYEGA